jgi:hypothetical protein
MAASSSGGIAKPAAYSGPHPLANKLGEDQVLEPVPFSQCVVLDQLGPVTFCLTNIHTGERVALPSGSWLLELDEDTGGAAVFTMPSGEPGGAQQEVLVVEDLGWKKILFRHKSGEFFIVVDEGRPQSFDTMRTKFSPGEIAVQAGASSATYVLSVSVFHLARPCSQSVYWDLSQLFEVLGMTSHKGLVHHIAIMTQTTTTT